MNVVHSVHSEVTIAEGVLKADLLGTYVHCVSMEHAISKIISIARLDSGGIVCVANVHMIVEAMDDPTFQQQLNMADLVLPDGMPLVWYLRRMGASEQQRVAGPDLLPKLCSAAAGASLPVGFLGGQSNALHAAIGNIRGANPNLSVAYAYSPPFRALSEQEESQIIRNINSSGAKILFVAFGCPKQERWMHTHRNQISATMIGIGAALDFCAGSKIRAPFWMQKSGLEWLHRFAKEPRRLWRRYLYTNSSFFLRLTGQSIRQYAQQTLP